MPEGVVTFAEQASRSLNIGSNISSQSFTNVARYSSISLVDTYLAFLCMIRASQYLSTQCLLKERKEDLVITIVVYVSYYIYQHR